MSGGKGSRAVAAGPTSRACLGSNKPQEENHCGEQRKCFLSWYRGFPGSRGRWRGPERGQADGEAGVLARAASWHTAARGTFSPEQVLGENQAAKPGQAEGGSAGDEQGGAGAAGSVAVSRGAVRHQPGMVRARLGRGCARAGAASRAVERPSHAADPASPPPRRSWPGSSRSRPSGS